MKIVRASNSAPVPETSERLLHDVRKLILATRAQVARSVNSVLVLHYWQIGQRIRKDVLQEKRAEYGQEILQTLSAKLVLEFGGGYLAELPPREVLAQRLHEAVRHARERLARDEAAKGATARPAIGPGDTQTSTEKVNHACRHFQHLCRRRPR